VHATGRWAAHPGNCSICTAAAVDAGRADHRRSVVVPSTCESSCESAGCCAGLGDAGKWSEKLNEFKSAAAGAAGWKSGCCNLALGRWKALGDRRGLSGGGSVLAVVRWWSSAASGDAGGWDEGGGIADDCGWNAKEEEEEEDGGRGGALGGRRDRGMAVRGRGDARGASERPVCAQIHKKHIS